MYKKIEQSVYNKIKQIFAFYAQQHKHQAHDNKKETQLLFSHN